MNIYINICVTAFFFCIGYAGESMYSSSGFTADDGKTLFMLASLTGCIIASLAWNGDGYDKD